MDKLFKFFGNKYLNLIFPLADFLHIYQLEEYNNEFFLRWALPRLSKRNLQKVGHLDWTKKAKLLYLLTVFAITSSSVLVSFFTQDVIIFLLLFIVSTFLIPIWLVISSTLLSPLDWYLKSKEIGKAKKKLSTLKDLKVIAIAGSVGKTTTKNFLVGLLRSKFKVFTPQGNFNTLIGISSEINTAIGDAQILVVELGEFQPGDLKKLADLTKPEILLLTKIGSQHLEKFGSQEEIIKEFKSLASVPGIEKIFIAKNNILFPCLKNDPRIVNPKDRTDIPAQFAYAPSLSQNLFLAEAVAQFLGVNTKDIKSLLSSNTIPAGRLKVTSSNGITIVDDSYNISEESVKNAFEYVKKHNGRKVLVTGGIVEQGTDSSKVNEQFGIQIAEIFDVVILAKNNFFDPINRGINKKKSNLKVVHCENPKRTPKLLEEILKKDDIVLVQNELPEQYWH